MAISQSAKRESISSCKTRGKIVTRYARWPRIISACADCGVGTFTLGEYYMVKDEVWELAWVGRRKPCQHLDGQETLCIGCLESRIGRRLWPCDFTDAPVNDLDNGDKSDRLRNRLTVDRAQWAKYEQAMAEKRERGSC
jgi:hypothetical protein